jgi:hypothetical protein
VVLFAVLAVFGLMAFAPASPAHAAPAQAALNVGPYDGEFHGMVYANNGSKAPISLNLTHRGNQVEGTVFVGEGLYVNAGVCGAAELPASSVYATGKTTPKNPRLLETTSTVEVQGIDVKVTLDSLISGNTIDADATIDLPWICGGDVYLTGTLHRA